MNTLAKIACRTVGTLGMGAAVYDAVKLGGLYSKNKSEYEQGKYLEKTYFNSRTTDNPSYIANSIRKKTFDLRSKDPIPSFWGKIKGGFLGATESLANSLPLVLSSSLALLSKGLLAKIGAFGVGACACYTIAREGLGIGKHNPMK